MTAGARQTMPAGSRPGQRAMHGTRKPPSQVVLFIPRRPPVLPPNQGPLSLVKITSVLSSRPSSLSRAEHLADAPVQLGQHVAIEAGAAFLVESLRAGQRLVRHRVSEVQEKRPVAVALDESQRPLGIPPGQRRLNDRVFDLFLAFEQIAPAACRCCRGCRDTRQSRGESAVALGDLWPRCHLPTIPVA